jgi:cytoplasmic iron level regulating protein YaaA (DUF328/UPF0246 family)
MKIVISPAKSLNFEKNYRPVSLLTLFLKESRQIQQVLKQESPANLSALMHISEKLADLNWERTKLENPLL